MLWDLMSTVAGTYLRTFLHLCITSLMFFYFHVIFGDIKITIDDNEKS